MYAAIVKLTIDPARAPAAAAAFTNEILPRVKSAEGFVGGYWLDPVDGEGLWLRALRDGGPSASFDTSSVQLVGTGSSHSQCGHPTRGCRYPVMLTDVWW